MTVKLFSKPFRTVRRIILLHKIIIDPKVCGISCKEFAMVGFLNRIDWMMHPPSECLWVLKEVSPASYANQWPKMPDAITFRQRNYLKKVVHSLPYGVE